MLKRQISISAFTFLFTCTFVNGFPQGAPNYSCRSLTPGHVNGSQVDNPPYGISVTRDLVAPGGTTSVILESLGDFPFLGFICAASDAADNTNNPLGRFSFSPSSALSTSETIQLMTCARSDPDTGVTHVSRSEKHRVDFDWTAPPDANVGQHFKLRCSFVQTFFKCWTNIQVDIIIGGDQQSTTESTFGSGVNGGSVLSLNSTQPLSAITVGPGSLIERNAAGFQTQQNGPGNSLTGEPSNNNQETNNVNTIQNTSTASDIVVSFGPSATEILTPSSVRLTPLQRPETTSSINAIDIDSGATGSRVISTTNASFQTGERVTNPTQGNAPNNSNSSSNVLISDNGDNVRQGIRASSLGANTNEFIDHSSSRNISPNTNAVGGSRRNSTTRRRGEIDRATDQRRGGIDRATDQRGPNVASVSMGQTTLSTQDVATDSSSSANTNTTNTPPRDRTTTRGGNVVPDFIFRNPNAFFLRSSIIRNTLSGSRNRK